MNFSGDDHLSAIGPHTELFGGEGRDTYHVTKCDGLGTIVINNYAEDEIRDTIVHDHIFFHHVKQIRLGEDLIVVWEDSVE